MAFNYSATAELFPGTDRMHKLRYQRFSSAAEAIRYIVEDVPKAQVRSLTLEVDEQRFNGAEVRDLYDATAFPLARAASA
jgi:hypothetical protein